VNRAALIDELRRTHGGVHTIILYGSHARGDATAESDIDVAAFSDAVSAMKRDARSWLGTYLDAFVYPTAALSAAPGPEMLKLLGAHILVDDRNLASTFIAHLEAFDRAGPPAPPDDHAQMLRVWARKMLARIRRNDVEAHYRRHWLLYQLLEDYFTLRNQWYRGPKLALAELARTSPTTFAAFERALAPDAPLASVEALVDLVA
jgi:hypothetical protein